MFYKDIFIVIFTIIFLTLFVRFYQLFRELLKNELSYLLTQEIASYCVIAVLTLSGDRS